MKATFHLPRGGAPSGEGNCGSRITRRAERPFGNQAASLRDQTRHAVDLGDLQGLLELMGGGRVGMRLASIVFPLRGAR